MLYPVFYIGKNAGKFQQNKKKMTQCNRNAVPPTKVEISMNRGCNKVGHFQKDRKSQKMAIEEEI